MVCWNGWNSQRWVATASGFRGSQADTQLRSPVHLLLRSNSCPPRATHPQERLSRGGARCNHDPTLRIPNRFSSFRVPVLTHHRPTSALYESRRSAAAAVVEERESSALIPQLGCGGEACRLKESNVAHSALLSFVSVEKLPSIERLDAPSIGKCKYKCKCKCKYRTN